MIKRNILLNPGPVTTTDSVKHALVVPDICHRETEFANLLKAIRQDLLQVVNATDKFTSILFTASGTGAIEACISSVISPSSKLLIINNGSYGQRMVDIATRYQIPTIEIKRAFNEPLPFDEIDQLLQSDQNITHLAMVHHETSTGLLNPIDIIGKLCHNNQTKFIVDAMSSFGGLPIDVNKSHIDFIISSSNKCLHGMPGMSFVVCNKAALKETQNQSRSYYFDLYRQYESLEQSGQMPFTPPVQIAYAFKQALDEYFSETQIERTKRYHTNYDTLINGLKNLGFTLITPEESQSKLLATVKYPENKPYNFDAMHDHLFKEGFTIYPQKLAIKNTFRLACLGHLEKTDIEAFIAALEKYMNQA